MNKAQKLLKKIAEANGEAGFDTIGELQAYVKEHGADERVIKALTAAGVIKDNGTHDKDFPYQLLSFPQSKNLSDFIDDYGDDAAKHIAKQVIDHDSHIENDWIWSDNYHGGMEALKNTLSPDEDTKLQAYAEKKYPDADSDEWMAALRDNDDEVFSELIRIVDWAQTSGIEGEMMKALTLALNDFDSNETNARLVAVANGTDKYESPYTVQTNARGLAALVSEYDTSYSDDDKIDVMADDLTDNIKAELRPSVPQNGFDDFDTDYFHQLFTDEIEAMLVVGP